MLTHFVAWLLQDWHNYVETTNQSNYQYEQCFRSLCESIGLWAFILLGVAMIILFKAVFNRK